MHAIDMTPTPPTSSTARTRILVIDDEPDICETLEMVLSSEGYEVVMAENGTAAVERAEKGEVFHLVITDLLMPGLSGVETVAALKRLHPGTQAIVVSGYASEEAVSRCREEGVVRLMRKPFHLDDLLQTVKTALDRANR